MLLNHVYFTLACSTRQQDGLFINTCSFKTYLSNGPRPVRILTFFSNQKRVFCLKEAAIEAPRSISLSPLLSLEKQRDPSLFQSPFLDMYSILI